MTGNALTLTSATFDTTGEKFGTAALSGGYGLAATGLTALPLTIECWAKASAPGANIAVAMGLYTGGIGGYLGMTATTGYAQFSYSNSANAVVTLTGTSSIADGNWHHLAAVLSGTSGMLFVDGALIATGAAAKSTETFPNIAVGNDYGASSYATYQWLGEIDEAAIWNIPKYTAAFTPPTSPYAGTETGLVQLWHLDGNGATGIALTAVVVAPNNSAIVYSPYNWLVGASSAKTICGGAYFKLAFTGTTCALRFDTSGDAGSYLPQIWYRIDGLYWQVARIAGNVACTMPTETTAWPKHTLEVVVKATSEFQTRWATQSTAVVLTSILLDAGASVAMPVSLSKRAIVLGDSITEGYHAINSNGSGADDVAGSDARGGWAYMLKDMLGVEVGVVGFGGIGLAAAGQGGVPGLLSSYASLWSGQARAFSPVPDLIVINIGENDGSVATATEQANYVTLLNGLLAACPGAPIAAMRPFSGKQAAAIQNAIALCSNPALVTYIDTTGFFDTTLSVDGQHPLGVANVQTIAPSVAALLRPMLGGGASAPKFVGRFY